MQNEIHHIWQEVLRDLGSKQILWQLAVIMVALGISWALQGVLRAYVLRHAVQTNIKLAIGSINRVVWPLSATLLVWAGKGLLSGWQHTSLLHLVIRLLLALALVRVCVYGLRYIFDPSGWLKAFERAITWLIWCCLALYLSGNLSEIIDALEAVQFRIGKNHLNLWLLLQGLISIVFTLFVALSVSRVIENKLMQTEQISLNMRVVLIKVVRIALVFVAVLFALSAVGLDITVLSVFGGALGVGLGLGLQKIASNYVSGFIILLDKSMQIGDIVTVDKHYGVIQEMRSRYSVIAKQDGTRVIIPNETLITSAVLNHPNIEHTGRVQINACVSFNSPLETAIKLMCDIASKHSRVQKMPAPEVAVKTFTEHGAELVLSVWVGDPENGLASLQSALYVEIWKAFKKQGITLGKPEPKVE